MKNKFEIEELCCVAEEQIIRKKLSTISEIKSLEFDYINHTVSIEHRTKPEIIANEIKSIGMQVNVLPEDNLFLKNEVKKEKNIFTSAEGIRIIVSVCLAIIAEILHFYIGGHSSSHSGEHEHEHIGITNLFEHGFHNIFEAENLIVLFSVIAILLCGFSFFKKAFYAIKSLSLNIFTLMFVAMCGAIAMGEFSEAAMVISLFGLSELLEKYSLNQAKKAIGTVVEHLPSEVEVLHKDHYHKQKLHHVKVGDIIRVKSGEKIAIDGEVISGVSYVNQATITGESRAVFKQTGDMVYAGSANQEGTFNYKATGTAENSTLNNIKQLVLTATTNRGEAERLIDKFAKIYTPIVFVLAILLALVPPLFFNGAWHEWLEKGLFMLVTGCPCALVISTPVTVVSALTNLANIGVIVKGGVFLELGSKIKKFVFDKTGTLTKGDFSVVDILPINNFPIDRLLHLAAAIEARSTHPIAKAIIKAHDDLHADEGEILVEEFQILSGMGAVGLVENQKIYVGNHRLAHDLNVCSNKIEGILFPLEEMGKTVVLIMTETEVLGVLGVSDTIREEAKVLLQKLSDYKTSVISGDNKVATNKVAQELSISEVYGSLLPSEKLDKISTFQQSGVVAMVGDGINDAPAIAKSDVGIALGSIGTEVALQAASVNIMGNNLLKILDFIRVSKKTVGILKQNLFIAIGIKTIFVIFALLGYPFLWLAVIADMGASIIVTLNGLRMLNFKNN